MTSFYDPAVLLDPSCFSFLHSPNGSMSDGRSLRNAPRNQHKRPTNAYLMNQNQLTSLTPSNQDSILFAAAGAAAVPAPSHVPSFPKPLTSLRMQSGQIPGSIHSSAQLPPAIAAELAGNVIEASSPFINRLFPQNRAPFPIDKKIFNELSTKGLFDRLKNNFIIPSNFKESTVCQWFNDIGEAMAVASHVPLKRRWWYGTGSLPPCGSDYGYKPDLTLLDQAYYDTLSTSSRELTGFSSARLQKSLPRSRTLHEWARRSMPNPM